MNLVFRVQRNPHFHSVLMTLVSAFLLFTSFAYGLKNDLDKTITPDPIESRTQQLAAAISDVAYGLNLGYAANGKVHAALQTGGLTVYPKFLEPLGLVYPANTYDPALVNSILQHATQLEGVTRDVRFGDGSLVLIQAEDLGMVDYFKLSFRLFGINVQGLYYTYWLLLVFSVLMFVVCWWRLPVILFTLNLFLFAHLVALTYVVLGFSAYEGAHFFIGSVHNGRFLSVLGMVPALHILLLLMNVQKSTWQTALATTLQVGLLIFVVTLRSSALWFVLALGCSFAVRFLFQIIRSWPREALNVFVQRAFPLPALMLFAGLAIALLHQQMSRNQSYDVLDEGHPGHLFWHSVFFGFTAGGQWSEFTKRYDDKDGDDLPIKAAEMYVAEMGLPPAYIVGHNFLRYKTYERVVKAASLDFMKNHLRYMAKSPYYKIRSAYLIYRPVFLQALQRPVLWVLAAFLALAGSCLLSRRAFVDNLRDVRMSLAAISVMAVFATVPVVVAYPASHAFGDQTYIYTALLLGMLFFGFMLSITALKGWLVQRRQSSTFPT